jgi:hypothetical protein
MGAVSNLFEGIGDILGSVAEVFGDIVEGVFDAVFDVVEGIGDFVTNVLKDPLPVILKIGGAMIGIPPYVTAAVVTAAKGGDLEDIAKSAAISFATSNFLQATGISEALGDVAFDMTDSIAQGFDLPLATAGAIADTVTSAAGQAMVGGMNAVLTGKDVMAGITSGFTSGLIYTGTNSFFTEINKDPNWGLSKTTLDLLKGSTSTALNTIVSGKGDPTQAVANYIAYATLKMGSSELYKTAVKAYEDFTGKTDLAQKAQDDYVAVKAKYDAEARKYNEGVTTLKADQAAYMDIYEDEYTPIADQLTTYKKNFDDNKAIYEVAKADYEKNKWAYENYDAKMRDLGYSYTSDENGSYYFKFIGGRYEQRYDPESGGYYNAFVPDGSILDSEGNPTTSVDYGPSQQSFLDAARANVATANNAGAAAKAASDSFSALNDDAKTQDIINRLKAKENSVTQTVALLEGIRAQIETPSGDNIAARLKAASDKYQKEYTNYATSKEAADRAAQNYNKIVAEIATRDLTIDAVNEGAIKVTGFSDGTYTLSNGMTLKDGKFYQMVPDESGNYVNKPVFTNAAGVSQNGLEFKDSTGNVVRFGADAGRQLSYSDVQNIFKRDYGLTLTDDEAKRFSGVSFTNYDSTKFQDHAIDRITREFESIANRKPTAAESQTFLNQDDSVAAAQSGAINGLDLPDGYVSPGASQAQKVSFGQAYAAARKQLGPGKTFQWTDDKGVTRTYITDTKEEAAFKTAVNQATGDFDTRDVSLVKGRLTEAIRMSNITGRFDSATNPSDLSEKEMSSFIDNYVKATPEQRAALLRGADSATYKVINDHLQNYKGVSERTSGQTYAPVFTTGEIKASNHTDYIGTVRAGIRGAGNDLVGLVTRAGQVMGEVFGYDTPTLDKLQDLMTKDKETTMNKLVGNERVVAGGLASGISSAISWTLGGPFGAIGTLGGIAANNAWIEGSNAVIDSKGRTWNNADEARQNGVFTFTKLTPEQNGIRTAVMTSLEIVGEALGVPGMSKLMKGIPITGDVGQIVNSVKNFGLGLGNEQVSELLTTTAQMAADKWLSVGLGKNATFEDYKNALADTALATTAAVGVAGSTGTALQNLRNAANTANPFSENTRETSLNPTLPSLNQVYQSFGIQQYDIDQIARGIENTIRNGGVGIGTVKDRTADMLQNLGATGARAETLANEMVDRVLNQNLTNSLTSAGLNQSQINAVLAPIKNSLTNEVGADVFRTQINTALANGGVNAETFGTAVANAVMSTAPGSSVATGGGTSGTTTGSVTTQTGGTTNTGTDTGSTTTTTGGGTATVGGTTGSTVTNPDALAAMDMALGKKPVDLRYDVNKDGVVTSADVLAISKGAVVPAASTTGGTTGTTTGGTTTGTTTGGTTTGTTTGGTTAGTTAGGTTAGTTVGGTTAGTTVGGTTAGTTVGGTTTGGTTAGTTAGGTTAGTTTGTTTGTAAGTTAGTGSTAGTTAGTGTTVGSTAGTATGTTTGTTAGTGATTGTTTGTAAGTGSTTGTAAGTGTTTGTTTASGLTTAQVQELINTTMAANPGLTSTQVQNIVNTALAALPASATPSQVQTAITNATANLASSQSVTDLATQVSNLGTSTQTAFNNLSAAQQAEVAARVQQGQNLESAIGTVSQSVTDLATNTQTAINNISNAVTQLGTQTQTAFDTLSAAQKAEVAARVQQGQNLESAINTVAQTVTQQGTQTQQALQNINQSITNLSQQTQTAFDNMSTAQKAEVNARVQMGQNLETAINTVQQNLVQTNQAVQTQLQTLSKETQAQFEELNANQKAEVLARVQMGENLQTAITDVGTILGGEITGIKTEMAAEKARQLAAQKAAQAKQQQQSMMARAQSLVARPGGDEAISGPTFKDPFMTSGAPAAKFEGPLEQFLKTVKEGTYTPAQTPTGQPMQQTQQAQQGQQPQQGQQQPDQNYFSYGTANEIDAILNPLKGMGTAFTPYALGAKEGGLASVLMAEGGTTGTRHGRYAGGGLNTVEHSGKMRVDFRRGDAVTGPGDGQSDDIPAMLADGEFVFPADVVAALGNGSTKAGSDKLYDMMHSIRAYHRSAKPQDLPPPAKKSPLDYLKDTKRKARR